MINRAVQSLDATLHILGQVPTEENFPIWGLLNNIFSSETFRVPNRLHAFRL